MKEKKVNLVLSSFVLGVMLLSGCGSSSQPSKNDQLSGQIRVENNKIDSIKSSLQSRNISVETSSYSKDKKYILIVGNDKGKTTFYKFDASTLKLIDQFSFDVDGYIGIKDVEDGNIYTIITQKEGKASDYILDMNKKVLEKKSDYSLKYPEDIIKEQLNGKYEVKYFTYTPTHRGAFVLAKNSSETKLFLYGLEDPNHPIQERAIFTGSSSDTIKDITFLDDGEIYFKQFNSNEPNRLHEVTYDYYNNRVVKDDYIGKDDVDSNQLRDKLNSLLKGEKLLDLWITPTKLGLFVKTQKGEKENLYLYGLEDLQNPKKEKLIASEREIKDIKIVKNGVISFTKHQDNGLVKTAYDYFNHKVLEEKILNNSDEIAEFERVQKEAIAVRKEQHKDIWGVQSKGHPTYYETIKVLAKLDNNKYLIEHFYRTFDGYTALEVWDSSKKKSIKVLSKNTMSFPNHHWDDLFIDRENHKVTFSYKTAKPDDFIDAGIKMPLKELLNKYDRKKGEKIEYNWDNNEIRYHFFLK